MKHNVLLNFFLLLVLSSALVFSSPALEGQESNPFLGSWAGSISAAGVTLDFTITFSRDAKSQMTGTIDVPAQGAAGIPLGKIKIEGSKISFVIDDPGASAIPPSRASWTKRGRKSSGASPRAAMREPSRWRKSNKPRETDE